MPMPDIVAQEIRVRIIRTINTMGDCPMENSLSIKRGDVFFADLGEGVGSEQSGEHPVVVIQNNIGNYHSPNVIIASITSKTNKKRLPTHVFLPAGNGGLPLNSTVLLEDIKTISKTRLQKRLGTFAPDVMAKIDHCIMVSLATDHPAA